MSSAHWPKTHSLNNSIELSFYKPETAQQIKWIKSHSPLLLLQREFLDSVLQIMLLTGVSMHWCPQSIFYKPSFVNDLLSVWHGRSLKQFPHWSSSRRGVMGHGAKLNKLNNEVLQVFSVHVWDCERKVSFYVTTIRSSLMRRSTHGSLPVRIWSGVFYFYCRPLFLCSRNVFGHHLQLSKLLV